jgi:hypothetical protein
MESIISWSKLAWTPRDEWAATPCRLLCTGVARPVKVCRDWTTLHVLKVPAALCTNNGQWQRVISARRAL